MNYSMTMNVVNGIAINLFISPIAMKNDILAKNNVDVHPMLATNSEKKVLEHT